MRLDTYDADKEEFPIICTFDDVIARIRYKVPIDMAKEFKENFNHDELYGKGQMWEALRRCDNLSMSRYQIDLTIMTYVLQQSCLA